MQNREDYFQGIRGICIICVILIHCMTGISFKNNYQLSFNYDYWLILRQLINFPVAVFIFLAGYFTNIEKIKNDKLVYFKNRGGRLLIPYLFWTVFYGIIKFLLGTKIDIKVITKYLLFGRAAGHLYFIVVLLQLTLITPILIKCVNKKWFNILCLLITPLYLVFMYICNFETKLQMPYYEVLFLPWSIFYYIGICLKVKGLKELVGHKTNKILYSFLFTVILLLVSCFECYFLISKGQTEGFAASQIKISSFVYSLSIINLFLIVMQYETKIGKLLIKIGDNSFGIYFIHIFYLICLNKLLSYIPCLGNVLILYQLMQLTLTLLLSYLTIKLVKRIFGIKISRVIFGF